MHTAGLVDFAKRLACTTNCKEWTSIGPILVRKQTKSKANVRPANLPWIGKKATQYSHKNIGEPLLLSTWAMMLCHRNTKASTNSRGQQLDTSYIKVFYSGRSMMEIHYDTQDQRILGDVKVCRLWGMRRTPREKEIVLTHSTNGLLLAKYK